VKGRRSLLRCGDGVQKASGTQTNPQQQRAAAELGPKTSGGAAFEDTRQEATGQRELADAVRNSPHIAAQRQQFSSMFGQAMVQRKGTGFPEPLKSGVESLSGMPISGVNAHYDSSQPSDIRVSPGQKRHLPQAPANEGKSTPVADFNIEKKSETLQRVVIPHAGIDGLLQDLNTTNYEAAEKQVEIMWSGGKIAGLSALREALKAGPFEINSTRLMAKITYLLNKPASWDPDTGVASTRERREFDEQHPPADKTGVTKKPGQGEVFPLIPTAEQANALNVRAWQIGDLVYGISWSDLGHHLQGRLSDPEYVTKGHNFLLLQDVKQGTKLVGTFTDTQKSDFAKAAFELVKGEVRGGLEGLPVTEGVAYRAADSAPGVYGSLINVGDYIKDKSFWSTSGLKLTHKNKDFGSEGTLAVPKVYYIIDGKTGVFLPSFTNTEVGVREVLFKNETIFKVTQITNYANRTFFVHVEEKDPAHIPVNTITKNPWSGVNNP
jgi:hypothetical protein